MKVDFLYNYVYHNNMKYKYKYFLYCSLAVVFILLDMLTKKLFDNKYIAVIDGIVSITSSHNTGAGFSIFSNQTVLLIAITASFLVIFALFNIFGKFKLSHLYLISTTLIFSGAIGNLIDRLMLNYVRDFIYFEIINFPIFNVADICLKYTS